MAIPRKDRYTRLAYLAGLIDGEGSFSCYRINIKGRQRTYGGITKSLVIHNTNKAMIETAAATMTEVIGVPVRWGKENRLTVTGKEVWYVWMSGGNQLRTLLPALIPYLVTKQKQAQLMLKLLERKPYSRVTQEEVDIVNEIRSLNDKARTTASLETNTLNIAA
jgi:hypothetical protein